MVINSINPANGQEIKSYELLSDDAIETIVDNVSKSQREWVKTSFSERAGLFKSLANKLRDDKDALAEIMTMEMGKLIDEARSEVDKCAWVCDFYADNAQRFLTDEQIETDASHSRVVYQPLGLVLSIMPWNFPFWQVFRCAVPALMAGNNILLKHASNVPDCALTLEKLFQDAGFPACVFSTLMISSDQVEAVITDRRVNAVSLTGSEKAGRKVASVSGQHLKKTLLELGGSDAFVILEDADLDAAVKEAVKSRFLNNGQSCIAAKRFIVIDSIADNFIDKFCKAIDNLQAGDPLDPETSLAPMAREDLRDNLHEQVTQSIDKGAVLVTGGKSLPNPGWYYSATLLDRVEPGMPAYEDEIFGPVASVIRAADEADALRIANDTKYGLGGSVWTQNNKKGEEFALNLECGCAFVNGMVKSDPRLPFGGIKNSGYGRELSLLGIREFVNAKTVWIK